MTFRDRMPTPVPHSLKASSLGRAWIRVPIRPQELAKVYSVLLVAIFQLVREGIRAVIERDSDFQVIIEAGDRSQIMQALDTLRVDLIVFELDPDRALSIETIKLILQNYPSNKIIALSTYDDDAIVENVVRAGVRGFLSKGEPSGDLLKALKMVAEGGAYLSPAIVARVMDLVRTRELRNRRHPALNILSNREVQVLKLLAEGKTATEIANVLHLSADTVRTYRKTMMHKLKIYSLSQLMQFALSVGLIVIATPKGQSGGASK